MPIFGLGGRSVGEPMNRGTANVRNLEGERRTVDGDEEGAQIRSSLQTQPRGSAEQQAKA